MNRRSAFTLIELLIVIAILSIVVVLTLSPGELLRQSRDATRLSDMDTMNRALGLYVTDMATQGTSLNLGNASTVYVSLIDNVSSTCGSLALPALPAGYTYHCASATSSRNADSNGWLPVNLKLVTTGSPLGSLPVDPQNSSSTGLYYTYVTNGSQYEVTSLLESQKYKVQYGQNPQLPSYPEVLAQGSNLTLNPLWNTQGLVGYWPMDEGSGSTSGVTQATDQSGNGNNGTWYGFASGTSGYYSAGKVGNWGGMFDGITNYIAAPALSVWNNSFTITEWINASSTSGYHFITTTDPNQGGYATVNVLIFNGKLCYGFNTDGGGGGGGVGCPTSISASTWYFIAALYDPSTLLVSLYVNGVLAKSITATTALSVPTSSVTYFGKRSDSYAFSGLTDDVRIYNRSLSASEVQALYNAEK